MGIVSMKMRKSQTKSTYLSWFSSWERSVLTGLAAGTLLIAGIVSFLLFLLVLQVVAGVVVIRIQ